MIVETIKDTLEVGKNIIIPINDTICHSITIVQKEWESSPFDKILENGITILIALIAGLVALYQVKSNIVSSARIKWIEELRQEISQLYNDSLGTILYWSQFKTTKDPKEYDKYDLAHSNFFIRGNKIRMNLNTSEAKPKELIKLIDKIEEKLDPENIDNCTQEEVEIILKEIVIISRDIFKVEWQKSKKIFKL